MIPKLKKKISKKRVKQIIIALWVLFLAIIIGMPIFIYAVRIDFLGLFGGLPSYKELENPKTDLSSTLYFADNVEMGKYFRFNRSQVEFDELSPNLINALIATEDYRFQKHSGIDGQSLGRVFFKSLLLFNKSSGGGSTISQQLAKILFRTRSEDTRGALNRVPGLGMLIIKVKEWIVAVQLERSYTKKEIIAMYLNTFDFGSNAYGIKTASQTFFNKKPADLEIQEAAVLVGLCKNPNLFSPVYRPENAFHRRNTVLGQMYKYNYISKELFDSLSNQPIELDYSVASHNQGPATYFRSVVVWDLLRWAKENGFDLYEDGLKIYTTIDSRMQKYAEEAVVKHMTFQQELFEEHWKGRDPWIDEKGREIKGFVERVAKRTEAYKAAKEKVGDDSLKIFQQLSIKRPMRVFSWHGEIDTVMSTLDSIRYFKRFLHTGFMAMDPSTGHIKAWVGGINHKYFKYDHVKQGRRQPGSTFKPIVYAAAIDNGYSPCHEVADVPVTFTVPGDPPTWVPSNSGGKFTGLDMTLREAMSKSVNSVTAHIMQKIGASTVVDYAKRLGIESPLAAVPSLCLGTSDVSIYELIGAYSTFVNEGFYTKPFFIQRIEDKNGNVLQEFSPLTGEALNEETAHLMLYMLRGATEIPGGTAMGLSREVRENNQIGAKTGTTQNYSDGWFVGVTKDLAAGVWVGGDDRSIHFRNIGLGQGARMAMPIWDIFMQKVYADPTLGITKGPFNPPKNRITVEMDCNVYNSAVPSETDSLNVDSAQKEVFEFKDIF